MGQTATQMTVMGPQTEKNSECFMSDGELDGESSVEPRMDFERMLTGMHLVVRDTLKQHKRAGNPSPSGGMARSSGRRRRTTRTERTREASRYKAGPSPKPRGIVLRSGLRRSGGSIAGLELCLIEGEET